MLSQHWPNCCNRRAGSRQRIGWCLLATIFGSAMHSPSSPALGQAAGKATDSLLSRAEPLTDDVFELAVESDYAKHIEAMLLRLGSPKHEEREAATKELVQVGLQTFGRLRRAYRNTDDLEVRLRIEDIARQAYLNHHVFDRNGFLGITMSEYNPATRAAIRERARQQAARLRARSQRPTPEKEKIPPTKVVNPPEGTIGADVGRVTPDTGAFRAGLQVGDVIIAVNGKPITGTGAEITNNLSKEIRSRRPGTTISLKLFRGDKPMVVDVLLGRCPPEVARRSRVTGTSDQVREMGKQFPKWWRKHFATGRTHASAGQD